MRPRIPLPIIASLVLLAAGRAAAGNVAEISWKAWPLPQEELRERFGQLVAPTDRDKIASQLVSRAESDFGFAAAVMACAQGRGARRLTGAVLGGKGFQTYVLSLERDDLAPALVDAARAKVKALEAQRQLVARAGASTALDHRALDPLIESGSHKDKRLVIALLSSPVPANTRLAIDAIRSMGFSSGGMFSGARSFVWPTRDRQRIVGALEGLVYRATDPDLVRKAMDLLGAIGPGRITEAALARVLEHPDPDVRYRAAVTLAGWKRVRFIEPIFEALKDNPQRQKAGVLESFCDLRCKTREPRASEPYAPPALIYDRKTARLLNAVLNAARANPSLLRAVPYAWGNVVDELRYTARSSDAQRVASALSDELFFFERAPWFAGKHDPQPLEQRRLLPTRWVPLIKRYGSTGAPEVKAGLEALHGQRATRR